MVHEMTSRSHLSLTHQSVSTDGQAEGYFATRANCSNLNRGLQACKSTAGYEEHVIEPRHSLKACERKTS